MRQPFLEYDFSEVIQSGLLTCLTSSTQAYALGIIFALAGDSVKAPFRGSVCLLLGEWTARWGVGPVSLSRGSCMIWEQLGLVSRER